MNDMPSYSVNYANAISGFDYWPPLIDIFYTDEVCFFNLKLKSPYFFIGICVQTFSFSYVFSLDVFNTIPSTAGILLTRQ